MEENALLTNITTIITKDILIDEANSQRKGIWYGNPIKNGFTNALKYPLLEPTDDEDLEFFLKQQFSFECVSKIEPTIVSATNANSKFKKCEGIEGNTRKRKLVSKSFNANVRIKDLDLLNEFDNMKFECFLHMNKMSFLKIFQFVRNLLTPTSLPFGVPPQTIFSLALWKLTTDEHFEEMSRRFQVSLLECESLVKQFWHIMSENYETYIRWPNSQLSQKLEVQGFQQHNRLKIFPQLFGVVAMKRLDIFLASEDSEIPVILQVVCNADQKVIDCFVELEQEYTFEETPMGQILTMNENSMPKDSYLIGNQCFPLKSYLIRPFSAPCFQKEQEFNRLLDLALELAQDSLDIMAKRFNALYALEARDLPEVRKILETICALHNLSIAIEDDYVDRKRQVVTFNWANDAKKILNIQGSEQNPQGIQRRNELLEQIMNDSLHHNS
uniref:DDE Tnp4 domain-containing protein n=1 Tax=Glossina austeni TaxID=7395 RepID=A0A1A9UUZ0_GLOAU